jgi:hypothetical protein
VAEVVRRSLYPRLEALRALHAFVAAKLVSLVSPNQVMEMYLRNGTLHPGDSPVLEAETMLGPEAGAPIGWDRTIVLLGEMLLYKAPLAAFLRESGYAVLSPATDSIVGSLAGSKRISAVIIEFGPRALDAFPLAALPWDVLGPRVVAISIDSSLEAKRKAFERGAKAYAVIPFTRKDILSILNTILASSSEHLPFYTLDLS